MLPCSTWDDCFAGRSYLILDGALGTCIEKKGETLDPLLWSAGHLVTNPGIIQHIHEEYLSAGADIVTTSAYQVSYEGLFEKYNYCTDQVNDLLRLSTDLARQAIQSQATPSNHRKKFVAASIGCYGAHLANGCEFFGGYSLSNQELFSWHFPKLQLLLQSEPDILAFETIPLLEEVKALRSAIGQLDKEIPSWISVACKSSSELNGGDEVEAVCRTMEDADDDKLTAEGTKNLREIAIGVNCTDPSHVLPIIAVMKECCRKDRKIVAYPNRGDFWNDKTNTYDEPSLWTPEQFAEKTAEWYNAGATIIGGCCKTDVSHIRAVSEKLREITS